MPVARGAAVSGSELQWAPGRPCQIQGAGAAGKSFAAYAAALALATGRPVWGQFRPSREAVRCIVLDFDGGGAQRRIQRLRAGMGIDPSELVGKLRIVSRPPVRLSAFKMEGAERAAAVDTFARAVEDFDLAIVDALRGLVAGVDENDSRIRDFLDVLGDVSERTGCTFVFLHHTGKGGGEKAKNERGRGSSAIQDGSGSVLYMEATEGHASTCSAEITRDHEGRDAPRAEPHYLRIVDVLIEGRDVPGLVVEYRTAEQVEGAPADKVDARQRELFRRILAAVKASPGATVAAVKGVVGGNGQAVGHAIEALIPLGAIIDRPDHAAKKGTRGLYLAEGIDPDAWEPPAVAARRASNAGAKRKCERCDGSGTWRDNQGRAGTCAQCSGSGSHVRGQPWAPVAELGTYPDRSADE